MSDTNTKEKESKRVCVVKDEDGYCRMYDVYVDCNPETAPCCLSSRKEKNED